MDADADGFGAGSMMWVCELDEDADGTDDYSLVGEDCDDDDMYLTPADLDTDGYATCEDLNGLSDCDDDDATTYPGAGFMEAGFDSTDYSTYECVTDGDGDGYAYQEMLACYAFELEDTYGDGWNGGMNIEVFADGMSQGTATVSWDSPVDMGESESTTICVDEGAAVDFVFNAGSYGSEAAGNIYRGDGSLVTEISGAGGWSSSGQSMTFDGVEYADTETMFSETSVGDTTFGGSDSDDSDASVW
jgi:hypothetical protein